jgi:hypothetical protein
MSIAFSLGWLYIGFVQDRFAIGGAVYISPAPIWRTLFWPMLAVLYSGAVTAVISLVASDTSRLRSVVRLAADALTLGVIAVLLYAGVWVDISSAKLPASAVGEIAKAINFGVWISLVSVAAITFIDALRETSRLFRGRRLLASALNV